jgi:hypothetical protein
VHHLRAHPLALAVALVFLSTMLAVSPHVWTGNPMVTAYVLAVAATAFGVCGGRGLRFSVLGERPARPSFPILPEPPPDDDPRSVLRQALDAASPSRDLRGRWPQMKSGGSFTATVRPAATRSTGPRSSRPATPAPPAASDSRHP